MRCAFRNNKEKSFVTLDSRRDQLISGLILDLKHYSLGVVGTVKILTYFATKNEKKNTKIQVQNSQKFPNLSTTK